MGHKCNFRFIHLFRFMNLKVIFISFLFCFLSLNIFFENSIRADTHNLIIESIDKVKEGSSFLIKIKYFNEIEDEIVYLENVFVEFANEQYLTDENGSAYIIAPMVEYSTQMTLSASKEGFESSYKTINIANDPNLLNQIIIDAPVQTNEGQVFSISTSFKHDIESDPEPLSNVKITFDNNNYISDSFGNVYLAAPLVEESVSMDIIASKIGYVSAVNSILIINQENILQNQLVITVDSYVIEKSSFDILVSYIDSLGVYKVVEDVEVSFNDKTFYTDSYGIVNLMAPEVESDKSFVITAQKSNFNGASSTIIVLNHEENIEKGWVYGTVINDKGEIISDANICLTIDQSEDMSTSICKVTDSFGRYDIFVPEGIYSIQANKIGYDSKTYTIEIIPNIATEFNFILSENEETPEQNSNQELIDQATYSGKVGGKITIKQQDNNIFYEELRFSDIVIDPITIEKNKFSIVVDGQENVAAKTIIISIPYDLLESYDDLIIDYDNTEIKKSDDLTDVLNPQDDGTLPEYYIVTDDYGPIVLISIPHFSEHKINIFSETIQSLGSSYYLALILGLLTIIIASIFMFKNNK